MGHSRYASALTSAGATVLAERMFGDYQGRWFALVEHEGRRGYAMEWFGSCSYCDPYEANVGYSYCQTAEETAKLEAEFAQRYLGENLLTFEEAMNEVKDDVSWDREAEAIVAWLNANR